MAPTNPAEQAKQSLDSSIKRFLLEQCSGGSSRKELQESDNLWDDLGLESKNVTSVIETVRDVRGPSSSCYTSLRRALLRAVDYAEMLSAAKGYGLEKADAKDPKEFQTVGDLCKYLEGQLGQ
ncbi:hypothetical protein Q7P36_000818 [Cladosporium allicinum]